LFRLEARPTSVKRCNGQCPLAGLGVGPLDSAAGDGVRRGALASELSARTDGSYLIETSTGGSDA